MSFTEAMLDEAGGGAGAAPGQYLGYALQPVRMCARLALADDGDHVSMEQVDDVAVHMANGCLILEQTKSALSHNPISDWATDLWKTFANWITTTITLGLDPNRTRYVLYVSPVKSGDRALALHNAQTPEQVNSVVDALRADLVARSTPPACANHIMILLDAEPNIRAAIISNFILVTEDDPVLSIRKSIDLAISPEVIEDICAAAIGWVSITANKLLKAKQPARIARVDFRKRMLAIVKHRDRDHVLNSVAYSPDASAIAAEIRRKTYIRQMELIECDSDEKVRAATDFLRAEASRTHWSDRGLVDETSLAEYDERLERRWTSTKQSLSIQEKVLEETEVGKLLMAETMKATADRLQGNDVPPYFPPGSIHSLADLKIIGWHPRFKDLLIDGGGDT
jgi:hypothetical protein